jgi:hypothetical protein
MDNGRGPPMNPNVRPNGPGPQGPGGPGGPGGPQGTMPPNRQMIN